VERDQPNALSACQDMNFFNTVAQKASAPILHIMLRIHSGRVKSTAKVVTTPAKPAMDPNKINARLVVLTVLVDRH
jgi:hypothetical protein